MFMWLFLHLSVYSLLVDQEFQKSATPIAMATTSPPSRCILSFLLLLHDHYETGKHSDHSLHAKLLPNDLSPSSLLAYKIL
jgi:hypothetical protein